VVAVLHGAVIAALAQGELYVLDGDPQVRNGTLLGFRPLAPVEGSPRSLEPLVAHWNDVLLPELLLARGKRQEEVWAKLRRLFREIEREGIATFRFRDLLDPLKSDTRRRWASLLDVAAQGAVKAGGATVLETRGVAPETAVESRQSLERLDRHVSAALGGAAALDPKTRDYLSTLWQYLRVSSGAAPQVHGTDRWAAELAADESLSHRRLSELLGIPRERLPGLFGILRRWVEEATAHL